MVGMSIKTDCWSLDIAFYKWAAKRLTYFVDCRYRPEGYQPLAHPDAFHSDEWADIVTEMRDTFQEAADSEETGYTPPSRRLRRALKMWADNVQYLWT